MIKEKQKRKIPLQVAKYAVGLDELVKDFHSYCQANGQMRDKIIGIFGMGGSGKTTLAKDLFNRKHSEFSESTIQFDVRENDVKGALTSLQSKLLNDLFPVNHHSFCSIEEGTAHIKHNFQGSRESSFLIVIDDVDNQMQLDAILPIDALNPNSLVIVTTRDERLLIQAGVRVRYKMKEMSPQHSRQLFCWHAFHRQSCKTGFENLVDSFVKACGGLPLALRVMGGHVFGSDKAYWKLQLDLVKARLHKDIKYTLKISYDALEEDEKQIFMDIACFFIGKKVSTAISIWKASKWRAEHALQTLKDKCLVEVQLCVDRQDTFSLHIKYEYEPTIVMRMHDHLRDLGREMANNESSNPCRLWRRIDLIEMQYILTQSEGKTFRYFNETANHMTYLLETSKTSTDLQWLELHSNSGHRDIPDWIPLPNLHTLRLEGVSPARLWQRDGQVPLKLRELYCCFNGHCYLGFTRHIFITGLNELVSLFGMLKYLESLYLQFGSEIQILEWKCLLKSVRELTNLKTLEFASLNVEGEFNLSNRGETTDDRFCMRSLEAITLCCAFKTRKVSISGQLCPTLKSLKLYSMADLIEVDLAGVTTLECLVLLDCGNLREVLGSDLLELEMFSIKLCRTIRELPNFGHVGSLKRIYIRRCRNLQDISAFEKLKGLKRIWISYCPELKDINALEQLKGLKRIWIEECTKLQGVICFTDMKGLKRIFIGGCARLQSIEGIEFLIWLESIIITACPKLQNIKGIEELKGLKEMIIADSPVINCVERLQRLPWDLTILVGRSAMSDLIADEDDFAWRWPLSDFNADKMGDTLSIADGFCEIECEKINKKHVEEMINSFHKKQHSLSTFIFCAILNGLPRIGSNICNGTRIMVEGDPLRTHTNLCSERAYWIYACVVNEEKLSKHDSWLPSSCDIEKAFLMGVKKGEERKTLHILESLFAQLCISNRIVPIDKVAEHEYDEVGKEGVDYDDLVQYVDKDEEYASGDDDYNDGVNSN
ncbi:disease resistance protein Roq1 isoform X2 [Cryptomeria japonica]|uniref:disease resistance protein Roq1 isoform X2 n=1 Tax=Cryptomeria japonica TaxID=3369 RepID=UPI0027DA7EF9|nr:disease resistance protein Roq1 isoform X2 [Cryptomeria japonica]